VLLVAAIILVGFLGFILLPWLKDKLFGETMDVRVNILSAFIDNEVAVPNSKETVARIVTELEIAFPYGSAPDSIADLTVRADDGTTVDINWGSREVEKHDVEDRSMTKFIAREAFFPIDFKQGMLRNKNRDLVYFKMPKLPFNPPSR
jgi:hypothetical protein